MTSNFTKAAHSACGCLKNTAAGSVSFFYRGPLYAPLPSENGRIKADLMLILFDPSNLRTFLHVHRKLTQPSSSFLSFKAYNRGRQFQRYHFNTLLISMILVWFPRFSNPTTTLHNIDLSQEFQVYSCRRNSLKLVILHSTIWYRYRYCFQSTKHWKHVRAHPLETVSGEPL